MQALLEGEPLSPAELREMLIRHILVEPYDSTAAPVTAALIEAWANVAAKAGCLDVVDETEALRMFDGKLPAAIPSDQRIYPRQVLAQVSVALLLERG
jgi:hypothetical protein